MDVLDAGECLVDFKHFRNSYAAPGSEIVVCKAEIDQGNTNVSKLCVIALGNKVKSECSTGLLGSYLMLVIVLLILSILEMYRKKSLFH